MPRHFTRTGAAAVFLAVGMFSVGTSAVPTALGHETDGPTQAWSSSLGDLVGWYVLGNGSYRMMTWAASGGLTLNDFETGERIRFDQEADDTLRVFHEDGRVLPARILRGPADDVQGIAWEHGDGLERTARRAPSFGYAQEEVRYASGGIEIVGLLLKPFGDGPHPAVVVAHGEGDADRDDLWYLAQADYLARHGVAVLLPDKRGCGKSGGSWTSAAFEELAEDVLAGIRYLRQAGPFDTGRLGVLGLREGGWIAPLAALRSKSVRYVVSVSGRTVSPEEQLREQVSARIRSYGTPDFLVPLVAFALERREKHKLKEWWEKNGEFDVREYWRELSRPALIVLGEGEDPVRIRREASQLERLAAANGNEDLTVRILPDASDDMHDPVTGRLETEYLDLLVSWIRNRSA